MATSGPTSQLDVLLFIERTTAQIRESILAGKALNMEEHEKIVREVVKDQIWDFSAPTWSTRCARKICDTMLQRLKDNDTTTALVDLSASNLKRLLAQQSKVIVKAIDFVLKENFTLAGGVVTSIFEGKKPNDLDIFAPGMTASQAEDAFQRVVDKLIQWAGKDTWSIYRTSNCITVAGKVQGQKIEIQLITRLYTSPWEVVYSFDLAPCAVAFNLVDGVLKLYATLGAEYAYFAGAFCPNLSTRRRTFETRIRKYCMDYGFHLVLPHAKTGQTSIDHLLLSCWVEIQENYYQGWDLRIYNGNGEPDLSDYQAPPSSIMYTNPKDVQRFNLDKLFTKSTFLVWDNAGENVIGFEGSEEDSVTMITNRLLRGMSALKARRAYSRMEKLTGTSLPHLAAMLLTLKMTGNARAELTTVVKAMKKHIRSCPKPAWRTVNDGTDFVKCQIDSVEWYGKDNYCKRFMTSQFDAYIRKILPSLYEKEPVTAVATKASAAHSIAGNQKLVTLVKLCVPHEWASDTDGWVIVPDGKAATEITFTPPAGQNVQLGTRIVDGVFHIKLTGK